MNAISILVVGCMVYVVCEDSLNKESKISEEGCVWWSRKNHRFSKQEGMFFLESSARKCQLHHLVYRYFINFILDFI